MTVWIVIIVLLVLFLIMPVGVDAVYSGQVFQLKLKIGLIKLSVIPGNKDKKQKTPKQKEENVKIPPEEKKLRLTAQDVLQLLKVVFSTLGRVEKHLSFDRVRVYWTAAAEDPCDAVMQYGGINAGLSVLMPYVHEVLKIRDEDIQTAVDFELQKPQIDAAVTATLQIWEILLVVNCAGAAALKWYVRKKKQARTAEKLAVQKGTE